ncbi:MAG TPA: prolipoprotein diacylglyceryl transferase [Nocardioides sp.]|nr:prolipoprotein diacylglyceryl transferase [Nocardioides sp.]
MSLLSIPSPSEGVWHIGVFPVRGYALCIIAGIVAAIWIAERRWRARGGTYGDVQDIAIWAVPFGLVGGRLYHVATDWEKYFGDGKNPVTALYVWRGGLGIWGAVLLGALGAWIGCRQKGIRFAAMADTIAPALLVAQAIGRWGNWFNQELYGRPTTLPWGLQIDPNHYPQSCDHPYNGSPCDFAPGTLFHPTFLYECLWNLAGFVLLLWLERKLRLGWGRTMAAYVMIYTVGRFWIEYLRIDDVQLEHVLGLRFNDWISILCFLGGATYFWLSRKRHPGTGPGPYVEGREPATAEAEADAGTDSGAAADPQAVVTEESTGE